MASSTVRHWTKVRVSPKCGILKAANFVYQPGYFPARYIMPDITHVRRYAARTRVYSYRPIGHYATAATDPNRIRKS